jgi:short-subunit dehydrogenase
MTQDFPLRGKTIVLTGASSGIGRGAAWKLSAAGANVVLAARRADALSELRDRIAAVGGVAEPVVADVADPHSVARLAQTALDRFGSIDVWVNNAGIGAIGSFWDVPMVDHARVIDVNVKGLLYGSHTALRHFRDRGEGILINVGSVESDVPLAHQSSYAASKAAVSIFGRCLQEELRLAGLERRIRVATILPWAIDTPFWNHAGNYTGRTLRMATMADPVPVVDAIVTACGRPTRMRRVGLRAGLAAVSSRLVPALTDRLSAAVADFESRRGVPAAPTPGALHQPSADAATVEGGVRERIRRENAARSYAMRGAGRGES